MSIAEIAAIKTEIAELLRRRMAEDKRSPTQLFGTASYALSESLADMLFSAAKSEEHGRELLATAIAIIESRWRSLAAKEKP